MSVATFLARPVRTDRVEELLGGALVVSPSANEAHGAICMELSAQLHRQCKARGLARVYGSPLTAVLDARNAPQPDISLILTERAHIVQHGYPRAAPDLAIEVLSASTRERDLGSKKRLYASAGVREYWIVDGDAGTVARYWLRGGRYGRPEVRRRSLRLLVLPQVRVDLAAVWRMVRGQE